MSTKAFGRAAAVAGKVAVDKGEDADFIEVPVVDYIDEDDNEVVRTLKAYIPSPGQVAVLMSSIGRGMTMQTAIAGVINFFVAILDEDDAGFIERKLLNGRDPFDLPDVQEIIEYLVGEWSGNPSVSLSGSSPSQKRSGPKSSTRTTKSTS